jgi:rhodanese-related sulfurtransferase
MHRMREIGRMPARFAMRVAPFIVAVLWGGCAGTAGDGAADLAVSPDIAVPLLGACDDNADAGAPLDRLSPAVLHALLEARDPLLINVHVPWDGDIHGTDARVDYTDIDALENAVGHARCAEIVLYCKGGGMSLKAGNALIERGYGRVRDLLGGTLAWEAAGFPIER